MVGAATGVVGVILAGGRSRRMGGEDKALTPLAGRPLVAHVLDRLRPQVDVVVVNSNANPERFSGLDVEVVPDTIAGFPGPLAGILAGLTWADANRPEAPLVATAPVDSPLFPLDFVPLLTGALASRGAEIAVARSRGITHPVFGVFPVACRKSLEDYIRKGGSPKVTEWLETRFARVVDFPAPIGDFDPFININTRLHLAEVSAALEHRLHRPAG
jgi:molybdenum cofactor guanylyltransferase